MDTPRESERDTEGGLLGTPRESEQVGSTPRTASGGCSGTCENEGSVDFMGMDTETEDEEDEGEEHRQGSEMDDEARNGRPAMKKLKTASESAVTFTSTAAPIADLAAAIAGSGIAATAAAFVSTPLKQIHDVMTPRKAVLGAIQARARECDGGGGSNPGASAAGATAGSIASVAVVPVAAPIAPAAALNPRQALMAAIQAKAAKKEKEEEEATNSSSIATSTGAGDSSSSIMGGSESGLTTVGGGCEARPDYHSEWVEGKMAASFMVEIATHLPRAKRKVQALLLQRQV